MLFENYVKKNCGCENINSDNSPSKIVHGQHKLW